MRPTIAPYVILSLSLLWATFAYWHGLGGGFMFDDFPNIVSNNMVAVHSISLESIKQAWHSGESSPLGRPIAMLTFALNHYISGMDPRAFKLVNIGIHLANGVAIFWLITLLARGASAVTGHRLAYWFAPAVAAIWLIHPFNLPPVLYVVQRMTSLATLFMVLSLGFYCWARLRMLVGRPGGLLVTLALLVWAPLAVLSKEIGGLIPWLIVAIEWFIFRFKTRGNTPAAWFKPLLRVLLFGPLLAALALLLYRPDFLTASYAMRDFTMPERLLSQTRVLWFYLSQTVVPDVSRMTLYQDVFEYSRSWITPWTTLPSFLGIVALAVIGILTRDKTPFLGLGIFFFLIGHALEAGPMALEMIHEHRNYFPAIGALIAFISGLALATKSIKLARLVPTMLIILTIMMGSALFLRAQTWGHPIELLFSQVMYHPESPRARYELGRGLALIYSAHPQKPDQLFDESLHAFEKAQALNPTTVAPDIAILLLHGFGGKTPDPMYLERVIERLKTHSHLPIVPSTIGTIVNCRQRPNCPFTVSDTLEIFEASLQNPRLEGAVKAQLVSLRGRFFTGTLRDTDSGLEDLRQAVLLDPRNPRHRYNLLVSLVTYGHTAEALEKLKQYDAEGNLVGIKTSLQLLLDFNESIENESLSTEEINQRWIEYRRRRTSAERISEPQLTPPPDQGLSPSSTYPGH